MAKIEEFPSDELDNDINEVDDKDIMIKNFVFFLCRNQLRRGKSGENLEPFIGHALTLHFVSAETLNISDVVTVGVTDKLSPYFEAILEGQHVLALYNTHASKSCMS